MSEAEKQKWWRRWRQRGDDRGAQEAPASTLDEPFDRVRDQTRDLNLQRPPPVEPPKPTPPPPIEEPPPLDEPPLEEPPPVEEPPFDEPPPEQEPPPERPANEAGRGRWFRRERSEDAEPREGWYRRLRAGLSRSSNRLREGIASAFTKRRLDEESLEELEELLIQADLGVEAAAAVVADFSRTRFGKEVTEHEVRTALATSIAGILEPVAKPLEFDPQRKPSVVLVCGVNGTGKTTTIGKLAQQLRAEGKRVVMAAGDTFRAAAIEQLQIWGERTGAPVVAKPTGADAAGLAFDALKQAREQNADVLLIDTAGRLHNKQALMDELAKIVRVLKKIDPEAPHHTLLVLDATTGQNARNQVETFGSMVAISGLVVTKLDGTARGGVVVALAERFGLPVHAVGVGEGVDDLRPFEARAFADALLGVDAA